MKILLVCASTVLLAQSALAQTPSTEELKHAQARCIPHRISGNIPSSSKAVLPENWQYTTGWEACSKIDDQLSAAAQQYRDDADKSIVNDVVKRLGQ